MNDIEHEVYSCVIAQSFGYNSFCLAYSSYLQCSVVLGPGVSCTVDSSPFNYVVRGSQSGLCEYDNYIRFVSDSTQQNICIPLPVPDRPGKGIQVNVVEYLVCIIILSCIVIISHQPQNGV